MYAVCYLSIYIYIYISMYGVFLLKGVGGCYLRHRSIGSIIQKVEVWAPNIGP